MMKNAKLLTVHALSPLSAGTGQGIGVIDLPIAREKATNLPYVPGSSIKGVLRDVSQGLNVDETIHVFGPDTGNADAHAGSAQFGDARLLLLPVRSVSGTFAWVSSPYLLARLGRDCVQTAANPPKAINVAKTTDCVVAQQSALSFNLDSKQTVVLEDARLDVKQDALFDSWATWLGKLIFPNANDVDWQDNLKKRLCIVHDDVFSFLLESGTEVIARNKLDDESKTVAKGGLWYEEALPTETVLVSIVAATPVKASEKRLEQKGMGVPSIHSHIKKLVKEPVQLGGSATIGRGVCRLALQNGVVS